MLRINIIILTGAIFAFCESAAILDKINKKCVLSDDDCMRILSKSITLEVADNGIPDMDIPKIDPYVVKKLEMVAFGMIKHTTTDGTVKGFKSCNTTSYKTDIVNNRTAIVLVCDLLAIEGQYKIEPTPTLLAFLGGIKIHGEGHGSIVIENLQLELDIPFEVIKLDDSELHFNLKPHESTYTFKILGNASITADSLFVGKQDISTVAINIFNENWEFISKALGQNILDKAMEVFFNYANKFFSIVPVKDIVINDSQPYC